MCQISFAVATEIFYEGCTVPISVKAGEGNNQQFQVKLYINDEDRGFIQTEPFIYYFETKDFGLGEFTIKAVYTSGEGFQVTDERTIKLLPAKVICLEEVIDLDGNRYPVVQIGNQCWMQTNIQSIHYSSGEALINGMDSLHEGGPTELPGWYFAYDRDPENVKLYGYLYTWSTALKGNKAADDDSGPIQGICPDGWHIPDINEWNALIDFAGGTELAGDKLKDTTSLWIDKLNSSNSTGFSAVPGGDRIWAGSYLEKGSGAFFWTATETIPNHAYHIYVKSSDSRVSILGHQDSKRFGYSVRCLKD